MKKITRKVIWIVTLMWMMFPPWIGAQETLGPSGIRSRLYERLNEGKKTKAFPQRLEGVISRITDAESVWVRIDDHKEFRRWTYRLSKASLDLKRQEIQVWLRYTSPRQSISKGKKYNEWFRQKAAYEMGQVFYGREVRVEYDEEEIRHEPYRMRALVYTGGSTINFWLIQNGWSFYLLEPPESDLHNDFLMAEQKARQEKLGLWKSSVQDSSRK